MNCSSLTITDPVTLGPDQLFKTNVPEDDYQLWDASVIYSLGDLRMYAGSVWESAQDNNVGNNPATSSDAWWLRVRPTNRWGAFDTRHSTNTAQAGGFWYEFDPGYAIKAIHITGMIDCASVRIRMTDPIAGLVYDTGELAVGHMPEIGSWWHWLFGPLIEIAEKHWFDLPTYPSARLRIDIKGGPACSVDTIMAGQVVTFGLGVNSGLKLPRDSFSRMEEDKWGEVVLERRSFIRGMNFQILIPNTQLDAFNKFMDARDAVVMFWSASARFTSTQIMGFYTRCESSLDYPMHTPVSIDVRGMQRK